jgi:hypothetical protein
LSIIFGILLATLGLFAVLKPFLWRGATSDPVKGSPGHDFERSRLEIYGRLIFNQQEFDLGNISEQEFGVQYHNFRFQAAELLRQQENVEQLDSWLEEEILKKRKLYQSSVRKNEMVTDSCTDQNLSEGL